MPISVRDVNRTLRARLWPALQIKGFDQRTDRIAWRYWDEGVDLVEVRSLTLRGDAVGCTSISFDAKVATAPT